MAYSTLAQVQTAVGGPARLLQLSDLTNVGTIDTAVVAAAIAEADAEIDGYVGHRYGVPLSPVPDLVSRKSAAWAARVLRRNLYNGQPLQDDLDREETDRKWLQMVAEGTVSLGIEPVPHKASIINDKSGLRDPTAGLTRDRLRGIW